jgi:CheY-like chemotaxis protein/serine phosphatase RsbU (regulator of sigma subunit)
MTAERILVVEDEPIVALQLKENLERLGYVVPEVVDSGSDVVPSVARNNPDLLLVDIHLRGGPDGIEAAYRAKAEFGVPVIFLTAYSDAETLRRAAIACADGFLLKPYDERELAANLKIALTKAKGERAMRRELQGAASIADSLDDPVIIVDTNGCVVKANRAAAEYLQSPDPARLAGVQISRILNSEPGDLLAASLGRRIGAERSPISVAKTEKLTLSDGRSCGELVVLGGVERRERIVLETSAAEANSYLESLLPGPSAAGPGYRVAGFLSPCISGSGDFYDVFSVGPGATAFYGLDVMGHGPMATMMAFTLRDLIPVIGWGSGGTSMPPSDVLSLLYSRYFTKDRSTGIPFFSIAYGTVDSGTGEYRVVRGGHTPVLHMDARGAIKPLNTKGVAVGLTPSASLEEASGTLKRGDRLLVASDGLLEVFGHGLDVAIKAFGAFARDLSGEGAERLAEAARRLVEKNGPREEDASLLVIERES